MQLCQIFLFWLFVGASTFEVQQTPAYIRPGIAQAQKDAILHDDVTPISAKDVPKTFISQVDHSFPDVSHTAGGIESPNFLSNHLAESSSLRGPSGHMMLGAGLFFWLLLAVFLLGACGGDVSTTPSEPGEKPVLDEIAAPPVETSGSMFEPRDAGGAWAIRFREARDQDEEALALLLRCDIISTKEFSNSHVSAEHIDECLWIAKTMLQRKPLEEWVARSQNGRQTFEASVAAVFEEMSRAVEVPPTQTPLCAYTKEEFHHVAGRKSFREGSLHKSGSEVSLGSDVTFRVHEPESVNYAPVNYALCGDSVESSPGPWNSEPPLGESVEIKPAPVKYVPTLSATPPPIGNFKSPVPRVNCFKKGTADKGDVESSVGSTVADDPAEEGVFASVFSSSFPSSATCSAQVSSNSSPNELLFQKSPQSSGSFGHNKVPAMRLQAREMMSPLPPSMWPIKESNTDGRTLQFSPRSSPGSMQGSPRGVAVTNVAHKSPPELSLNPRIQTAPSSGILGAAHSVLQSYETYGRAPRNAISSLPQRTNSERWSSRFGESPPDTN